jgi:hypothetical protein
MPLSAELRRAGATAAPEPAPVALRPTALALRTAHAAISIAFLSAIAYVWWCALTGRRTRLLRAAVAALTCEGAAVAANGGDCPLGRLQERAGDPVPLFELVLSPRAAKRAVPTLGAVAAVGIALLVVNPSARAAAAVERVVPTDDEQERPGRHPTGRVLACEAWLLPPHRPVSRER